MRRILSLVLILSFVLSLAVTVSAEETPTSGKYSDTISWTLSGGVLTISGTGPIDTRNFTNYPWYSFKDKFHKVIVEEGITSIGYCCFVTCSNLEEIELPDSLEVIGLQALDQTKIKTLNIPKNVHTIGENSSIGNQNAIGNKYLENIFVDDANTHYYDIDGVLFCRDTSFIVCFPQQKKVDTYTVPDGIKGIGDSAFLRAPMTSIILPQGLETIAANAFIYSSLTGIQIPDTVTKIGTCAFMTNKSLKEITIPASVTQIGIKTFHFCNNLETITFLNPECQLIYRNDEYPQSTTLVGYQDSTIHEFAKKLGYKFRDIQTGVTVDYYREGGLPSLLPKDLAPSYPAYSIAYSTATGYQPFVPIVTDSTHPTYQDIYNTTMEITKNCSTDSEKAKAVMDWLYKNVTYAYNVTGGDFSVENVYSIWESSPRIGNCMVFTKLTNFMLSILKIPNATVTSATHAWSMALLEGEWVPIDTTNGSFDGVVDVEGIISILFCDGDLVCAIEDFSGIKLTSYGSWINDVHTTNDIYIPSYVSYIYKSTFLHRKYAEGQEKVTVRGEKGSYAETYVRENTQFFKDYEITYEGTRFVAKPHTHTPGAYKSSEYDHWQVCSTCGATLGYYNHRFDNCSDTKCDDCGYTRQVSHSFSGEWFSNDAGHWQQCSNYNCSATSSVTAHSWDAGTSDGSKTLYTCTVCKKQKTESVTEPTQPATTAPTQPPTTAPTTAPTTEPTTAPTTAPTTEPTTEPTQNTSAPATQPPESSAPVTTPSSTSPTTPAQQKDPTNGPSIILWVLLAVVVLGTGGTVAVLLLKKRSAR